MQPRSEPRLTARSLFYAAAREVLRTPRRTETHRQLLKGLQRALRLNTAMANVLIRVARGADLTPAPGSLRDRIFEEAASLAYGDGPPTPAERKLLSQLARALKVRKQLAATTLADARARWLRRVEQAHRVQVDQVEVAEATEWSPEEVEAAIAEADQAAAAPAGASPQALPEATPEDEPTDAWYLWRVAAVGLAAGAGFGIFVTALPGASVPLAALAASGIGAVMGLA